MIFHDQEQREKRKLSEAESTFPWDNVDEVHIIISLKLLCSSDKDKKTIISNEKKTPPTNI